MILGNNEQPSGMPNETDENRIMLGLGYQNPSFPNYTQRCHLPLSLRDFFVKNATDVELRADFHSDDKFKNIALDTIFNPLPTYLE